MRSDGTDLNSESGSTPLNPGQDSDFRRFRLKSSCSGRDGRLDVGGRMLQNAIHAIEIVMPTLPNARHELFAQKLARGLTQRAAYKEAGFKGNGACASRLAGKAHVKARLAALLARKAP